MNSILERYAPLHEGENGGTTAATPAATPAATEPAKAAEPAVSAVPAAGTSTLATAPAKPGEPAKPAEPTTVPFDAKALKLPEGYKPDEKALNDFSAIVADTKLSPQDRGQKLLDLQAGLMKQLGEANSTAWADQNAKWVKEIEANPTFAGDKMEPARQDIAKLIDSLGAEKAEAFRTALNVTGAGNHPALFETLHSWAKQLVEGGHINGGAPKPTQSIQQEFFPNSPEMKG